MADEQAKALLAANFYGAPRIQWTPPLHERFLSAVTELGGPYEAKPKAIMEKMGVEGLTLRHIKSHLQKYRITIGSAGRMDDSSNSEQAENELTHVPVVNNAPLPPTIYVAHDMGDYRAYDVPGVQTAEGILNAPYDIRGNEIYNTSQVVTETQGTSMAPAPCDVRGLRVYGASELLVGKEEVPNMLQNSYDIRSQDDYASLRVPNETEVNPYLVSARQSIGSYGVYDIPGFQSRTEGMVEQERYINDEGNHIGAFNSTMNYSNNSPLLPTWETTCTMRNQEIYNQSTIPQVIEEGVVQEEYQYYGDNLNSGNNNKGKGITGLPPYDVVTKHLDLPTNSMPSINTMPTPYGMGGYKLYDGSSIQKEMEGGLQHTSEEYQYYKGSLNSGNNKGKGIMGLPPHDDVANHLDLPTDSMPSFNTVPTPYAMGGYELYDRSNIQREMEAGVQQASKEYQYYEGSLNSGNNNKGKGIMGLPPPHDVVANHLGFPTNNMPSFNRMPTPNEMGGYEVCDGSNIQRKMEGGVSKEYQYYRGTLNSGNNNRGNEIMELPPHDVVANRLDFPTNMPSFNMVPTPYGMGDYEVYDGSRIQREMGGAQQESEVEKHLKVREGASKKYI